MQRFLATVVLWAGLLLGQSAAAQVSIHLKVDGVPGESQISGLGGWHMLDSWLINVSWPAGGTRATFEPLTVVKSVGTRSPVFGVIAGTGQVLKEVVLDVRRMSSPSVPYYMIVLRDAVVRSYQVSGNSVGLPKESITFGYGRIEWSVYPINPDGTTGTPTTARWDVVKNSFY